MPKWREQLLAILKDFAMKSPANSLNPYTFRAALIFFVLYTAVYILGYLGKIDSALWGMFSTLSYFPASISQPYIDHFLYDRFSEMVSIILSYFLNCMIGVMWWILITTAFIRLKYIKN